MKEKVSSTIRVAGTQEAAGIALSALPKTTKLGLWFFSIWIGAGDADYKQVAPIGRLDDGAHRAVVAAGAASLSRNISGGTGLYDTIWAAYPKAKRATTLTASTPSSYSPTGATTTPAAFLDQLKANLRRVSDPSGAHRHHDHLHRTRRRSQGAHRLLENDLLGLLLGLLLAPSPVDVTTVIARAPFDHECKSGRCV